MIRLFYLALALNILCAGCTEFNPATRQREFIMYSTDREVRIGSSIAIAIEREYELVSDPLIVDRVNEITERVVDVVDRRDIQYYVRVIKAKEEEREQGLHINAFALPGGYIYIFDGLIDFSLSDDEIACVIGHEMGHIVAKHSIKKLQAIMGYTFLSLASVGAGESELARGAHYAFAHILTGYSRDDELLADRLGARYAKQAGYDAASMVDFLTRLQEKGKRERPRPKSYLRTHPYSSDRILAIKQELSLPLTFRDIVNIADEKY